MVEIGIPSSDPLADGPVIQDSSQIALTNGMTLDLLFRQLEGIQGSIHIPLCAHGISESHTADGHGRIFPQVSKIPASMESSSPIFPLPNMRQQYSNFSRVMEFINVLLISPHTEENRIRRIAGLSGGFLYLVADAATTGARSLLVVIRKNISSAFGKWNCPYPDLLVLGYPTGQPSVQPVNMPREPSLAVHLYVPWAIRASFCLEEKVEKLRRRDTGRRVI